MKKHLTLTEQLIVVVIVALLVVILLPIVRTAKERQKINQCKANLNTLAKAHYDYMSRESRGIDNYLRHFEGGGEYWLVVPTFDVGVHHSALWCPLSDFKTPGQTNYRGPLGHFHHRLSGDAIGCDRPGNHGTRKDVEMSWVGYSGYVYSIPANSPEWADVLEKTED